MARIHSVKHIIDSEGALAAAANSVNPIANGVAALEQPFDPLDVAIGESVNNIFLSIFMIGATGSGQDGSLNWYIVKTRAGQFSSLPLAGETGVSNLRNQIFHEEKGLAGSADGTAMAFKGVIKVPKLMRRMREGDNFYIVLRNTDSVNNVNFCIKAIYKSFS